MPKPKKRTISIFILAAIALYIVIGVIPTLTGALTRTEILEYGDLKARHEIKCWIIRSETVYSATSKGTVEYKVDEGTLLRKGAKVLGFTPAVSEKEDDAEQGSDQQKYIKRLAGSMISDSKFTAARKGIFTTMIDGYENYFTPENMEKLKYSEVKDIEEPAQNIAREKVTTGEPIYKIADNSEWFLVFWIDSGDIPNYKEGSTVKAELPEGSVSCSIKNILQEGERWRIIARSTSYYKNFVKNRMMEGYMVTTDTRGLLVSNSALTTRNDVTGLYVKKATGEYEFVPVSTIATDGEKTLLAEDIFYDENGEGVETVKVYDEVLKNPEADKN